MTINVKNNYLTLIMGISPLMYLKLRNLQKIDFKFSPS